MLFVFFFLKVNAEKVHSRLEIKIYEEFTMLNMIFFCNRRNSLLSFGGPHLYNSEALPFTYDQYVGMGRISWQTL